MIKGKMILTVVLINLSSAIISQGEPPAPQKPDTLAPPGFIKTELNSGLLFFRENSRESTVSSLSQYSEQRLNYHAYYDFGINSWNLGEDKQEIINLDIGAGPIYATGHSKMVNQALTSKLNDKVYGAGLFADLNYSSRFYYDDKNYVLVETEGYGRFEKIKIHAVGNTVTNDGTGSVSTDEKYLDNRLRYGINSRAGWGFGKLNPVNYFMEAEYLFNKYYSGKLFSPTEKQQLAGFIADIKNNRSPRAGHSDEKELEQVKNFLKKQYLLRPPEEMEDFWRYGEFVPRYSGKRVEFGPFFNYYSREPDFIYGGYAKYESEKYRNNKWNTDFSSELSYNWYKQRDWFFWQTGILFDYYRNLRSRYSFGMKYIPALIVNEFKDIKPLQHVLIPYIEYFLQLNEKQRLDLTFSYKITGENDFFLKGPEFSLAFYSSRY